MLAVLVCRGLVQARSVKHAALVGGDHVLNVNECIISAVCLEELESLDNQVAKVLTLALTVVDSITLVQVLGLEEVHDGENLTVVWHEGLTDGVAAEDEGLEDVEGCGDNLMITGVQGRYTKKYDKKVCVLNSGARNIRFEKI